MELKPSLRLYLLGLPRPAKQLIFFSVDLLGLITSACLACWLVYGFPFSLLAAAVIGLAAATIGFPVAVQQGLYKAVIRYVGAAFLFPAFVTAASAAIAAGMAAYWLGAVASPLRVAVAFGFAFLVYLCASRYLSRGLLAAGLQKGRRHRTVVYGAGTAAAQLIASMRATGEQLPVAMVDDEPALQGRTMNGIRIYAPVELQRLIDEESVNRILLAMPSVSRRRRSEVLDKLASLAAHVQTIPDYRDLVTGAAQVDDLREVPVEDLLGRQAVPPDPELLQARIRDRVVMVTGAGGSIGAELSRQILQLGVRKLILFEISEAALYQIDRELRQIMLAEKIRCEVVPLLGSVCDYSRLLTTLQTFSVQTVYHAAAYKHVPLVEQNIIDGTRNNALGTLTAARAACDAKVDTFVLISTDKAVRPTNIMGASKRVAELILQALQVEYPDTCFSMVRFGNVLESSGSVVPLFREQIRRGGPVTVTHPEIVRYFMTIPEAAELVIQAASMATGGDVFVLDMGAPIKISDLAQRMIRLSGMTVRHAGNPEGDIDIVYTGLRPAEKLYEELLVGADVSGTDHPRILRAVESYIPYQLLAGLLKQLAAHLDNQDCPAVRDTLRQLVESYKPTNQMDDLLWREQRLPLQQPPKGNVTRIA